MTLANSRQGAAGWGYPLVPDATSISTSTSLISSLWASSDLSPASSSAAVRRELGRRRDQEVPMVVTADPSAATATATRRKVVTHVHQKSVILRSVLFPLAVVQSLDQTPSPTQNGRPSVTKTRKLRSPTRLFIVRRTSSWNQRPLLRSTSHSRPH